MTIDLSATELAIIWQALEGFRERYDSEVHMRGELSAEQFNRLIDKVGAAESAARNRSAGEPAP